MYKEHYGKKRLIEDENDSIKTANFKKFAKLDQFEYFINALKNFTGIEANQILKLIFHQSNFKADIMQRKIKMNMVRNYDMKCECGYKEDSFIHKLLFCNLTHFAG